MADSDLPVFSFRPNWREGVVERLGFLTDVIRGGNGNEQRRRLRQTPRRSIEADFLLSGPERAYFDLFQNRFGGGEFMVPLFWDMHTLRSPVLPGDTTRIAFDTTRREFQPGLAILMGRDARVFEVVEIEAVDNAGVDLALAPARRWPVGSLLMPLRRGQFDESADMNHLSSATAQVSARLLLTAPNPWTPTKVFQRVSYANVLEDEPNWSESLSTKVERALLRLDPGMGRSYQRDPYGRAETVQAHRWFLKGREALASFRDLLYRQQGRQGALWVPSFKDDLRLTKAALATDGTIEVANVGWTYAGGPTDGRRFIAIRAGGQTLIRAVTTAALKPDGETEVLSLDRSVGLALQPGQVQISFADYGRFDQDEIDITHFAGVDGLSEVNANVRTLGRMLGLYVVEIDLPMKPMPVITPASGVRHGNISVGIAMASGGVNIEMTDQARPDVPGTPQTAPGAYPAYPRSLGFNEWVDVTGGNGAVVCRYRYDSNTNRCTVIVGERPLDIRFYPVGDRVLSGWTPSQTLKTNVYVNGLLCPFDYSITDQPDTDSNTGLGTMPFPVVDYDMHYRTPPA